MKAVLKSFKDGQYTVKIMDGSIVCRDINKDFTDFATSHLMDEVPENEIWIDRSLTPKEYQFFIMNAETVEKAIKQGKSKEGARKAGDAVERELRRAKPDIKVLLSAPKEVQLRRVVKETLGRAKGVPVRLVDGYLVRGLYDIDHTEGSQTQHVSWLKKLEGKEAIWIDNALPKKDRPFVIGHEIGEREDQEDGMSFEEAYGKWSAKEQGWRKNPDTFDLKDLGFIPAK
jgi:hypothetical protein